MLSMDSSLNIAIDVVVDVSDLMQAPSDHVAVSVGINDQVGSIMHYRRSQALQFQHLSAAYVESKADGAFRRVPLDKITKIGIDSQPDQSQIRSSMNAEIFILLKKFDSANPRQLVKGV